MQIDSLAVSTGPTEYYDYDFRSVLEDHMTYLRTSASTTTLTITQNNAYIYQYDFYGLLAAYNIDFSLRWVIMRMNNMYNPATDPIPVNLTLLIPNAADVDQIRQSHVATRVLNN